VYTNKESALYLPSLEARIASNAKSPSFARLASYYLGEGQHQKALEICQEGLKHFPEYATAHFVLGKCYEAMGRNIEAMLEYRRTLKAMPDSLAVQSSLRRVEQQEQEAYRAFSEERSRKLQERTAAVSFESYANDAVDKKESTADFLLRRLQEVKKTAPRTPFEQRRSEESGGPAVAPSKIVTATLAEIYATQGEYGEAIEAYKKLITQRPIEAERYAKRIAQLEELSKLQQAEQQN
jgi:tetratricopeptide (TPR) repeat protein